MELASPSGAWLLRLLPTGVLVLTSSANTSLVYWSAPLSGAPVPAPGLAHFSVQPDGSLQLSDLSTTPPAVYWTSGPQPGPAPYTVVLQVWLRCSGRPHVHVQRAEPAAACAVPVLEPSASDVSAAAVVVCVLRLP